ncbi:MAG: hypothetical protein J5W83_19765 [Candidatus Accumulibacter sp.]|uniref:TOPRIM nucleotidyl transferase/hydrolase domain-containing protein n=1 Tax=Accumulibacter sp. TaxID=2053492 RepID=UPI001B26C03B|nr:TOPRIM nucleotidyl transferase/hydrolase domain-containing protein [Accumulibacter sp.]MBO3704733.1 hypothetical protein [Accumulibacter sp.]
MNPSRDLCNKALPIVTEKFEVANPEAPKLSTQYSSIIEVGGAYAHRFVDLLEFLELRTLIITDIDATLVPGGAACPVHQGTSTSNGCMACCRFRGQRVKLA